MDGVCFGDKGQEGSGNSRDLDVSFNQFPSAGILQFVASIRGVRCLVPLVLLLHLFVLVIHELVSVSL